MSHILKTTATTLAVAVLLCANPASAQTKNLGLSGAEYYAALGTSDMGYTSSGFALRLGVDSAPIVPLGMMNIGATAFYTYTSSTYDYSFYNCSWKYYSHVFSAGPTLNLPLPNTRFTFQGRVAGSYGLLRSSVDCGGGNTATYTADHGNNFDLGFGAGVKYKLTDKITLRADWDDWGYSTLSIGIGIKF